MKLEEGEGERNLTVKKDKEKRKINNNIIRCVKMGGEGLKKIW